MIPKEKAIDLVENFRNVKHIKLSDYSVIYNPTAKQLAILCVKEIIESRKEDSSFDDTLKHKNDYSTLHPMYLTYWIQVINEIENL
jgi:hypothetical protein